MFRYRLYSKWIINVTNKQQDFIRILLILIVLIFGASGSILAQLPMNDVSKFMEKGHQLYRSGDYAGAIKEYSNAIVLDKRNYDAFFHRGSMYLLLHNHDKAILDLDNALRINPNHVWGYVNRGCCRDRQGDVEKALEDFSKAIQLDAKHIGALCNRASTYLQCGDIDKALIDLNNVMLIDPDSAVAFSLRGFALSKKGEFEKAIKDLNKSLKIDPNNIVALRKRGFTYTQMKEYDKAIEDLNKALILDPNDPDAYFDRIDFFIAQGMIKEAYADAVNVHKLYPTSPSCLFCLAETKYFNSDWEGSLFDLDKAIELSPNYANAYAFRALVRVVCAESNIKNTQKSLADAKKACDLTKWKLSNALESYAAACAANGDFAEAVKWQKKVVEDTHYVKLNFGKPNLWLELFEEKKPVPKQLPKRSDE